MNNFDRFEEKYLLTEDEAEIFKKKITLYIESDREKNSVCNIYYDTSEFEIIQRSLEKPVYKEKLRIRSYGVPKQSDPVFLELKKKYKGIVYKRRISVECSNIEKYLDSKTKDLKLLKKDSQILTEIRQHIEFFKVKPMVFIGYDREAFFCNNGVRITFDRNLRYREFDLDLAKGSQGNLIIQENPVVMELKYKGACPLWLSDILTSMGIHSISFSKYGTYYKRYVSEYNERLDSFHVVMNGKTVCKNELI